MEKLIYDDEKNQKEIIFNVKKELAKKYNFSDKELNSIFNRLTPLEIFKKYNVYCARVCDECGQWMDEGYYANGEYYCSDKCLYKHYTDEQWEKLCDDDGEYYWTEWWDI